MQPFIQDDAGVVRFKSNGIVCFLLDNGPWDLDQLTLRDFPQCDWEEFYQLIGYSLAGYHELSGVSDETCLLATRNAQAQGFEHAEGCRDQGCVIHCGTEKHD